MVYWFFFQAEDGIRDLVRSRGLGDVYKRQLQWPIPENANISINTLKDDGPALELIRHDCAHIMLSLIHI